MIADHAQIRAGATSRVFAGIVFLYMLLTPLYVFESGYPQPADMLMAAALVLAALTALARPGFAADKAHVMALAFGGLTFIVNIIHYGFYTDTRFLLSSLYYFYNAAVFIFISTLLIRAPAEAGRALYIGIGLSLVAQILFVSFIPSEQSYRAIGSFNNPNQLAYWALLCAASIVVLKFRRRLSLPDYVLLLAGGYIQTLSLSKAGIITYSLLMLALLFSKAVRREHRVLASFGFMIFFIALAAGSTGLMERMNEAQSIRAALTRIHDIGREADDNAQMRGYTRLLSFPEYLLLGAGEGGYDRFDDGTGARELHSGLATLAFSYGPAGVLMFCALLYFIFRKQDRFVLVILALVMLFGAVHQNIRFPMFWVFLAAVYGSRAAYSQAMPPETYERVTS
jgi:hypothetical protein